MTIAAQTRPEAPILIFDIETVPDVSLLAANYKMEASACSWNDLSLAAKISEEKKVAFFAPIFHRVICICAVYVRPGTFEIMDGFRKTCALPQTAEDFDAQEKELLQAFWTFATKYKNHSATWYDHLQTEFRLSDYQRKKLKPLPVVFSGFNITDFDLPVVEQRSLVHLLSCPIAEYTQELGTDSYRYRYAADKVFDLCQYISNYMPHARAKLDTIARAIGLGGKMKGMDGSKVAEHFFAGEGRQVEEYCAVDVLVTYGVYLAVQRFRGILTESHFEECKEQFFQFLMQEGKPATFRDLAESSMKFFRNSSGNSTKNPCSSRALGDASEILS